MAQATVVFARVSRKEARLFQGSLQDDLHKAIDPALEVTRYGRTWRFSKPEVSLDFLMAKLGFIRADQAIQIRYDDSKQDFLEESAVAEMVQYSHWVLDLHSLELTFELRPPDINTQSFIGAFLKLINVDPDARLTVEPILVGPTFDEWYQSVNRISKFHATLHPPNPHYSERTDLVRAIVEAPRADRVILDATKAKDDPDGLIINGTILGEVVEFEAEGYAEFKAQGETGQLISTFSSTEVIRNQKIDIDRTGGPFNIWRVMMGLLRQ